MLVLAFDTSTAHGGVAILQNQTVLSRAVWERQGSHGENLTPQIQKCLEQAGIELADLDALAVGIGPGSFTGVRVAINAAKSFGFALDKPVFAFDTAEIIAQASTRHDLPLIVIINAHKNSVFAAKFNYDNTTRTWLKMSALAAVDPAHLGDLVKQPTLCLGDGFLEYQDLIPAETSRFLVRDSELSDYPRPETFGILVEKSKPLEWKDLQALYIRESGAEEKLREGRKN